MCEAERSSLQQAVGWIVQSIKNYCSRPNECLAAASAANAKRSRGAVEPRVKQGIVKAVGLIV